MFHKTYILENVESLKPVTGTGDSNPKEKLECVMWLHTYLPSTGNASQNVSRARMGSPINFILTSPAAREKRKKLPADPRQKHF